MQTIISLCWLAVGGACGTLARVGLARLVDRGHETAWPWGTLTVNALGCLGFGVVWGTLQGRLNLPPVWSLALLGGFCGAFTTFSTFAFEAHRLAGQESLRQALGYVLVSNVSGLAMVWLGLATAAWWSAGESGAA